MIKFIKELIFIVNNYRRYSEQMLSISEKASASAKNSENYIKNVTTIHADAPSHYDSGTIIVIGKYKNGDYVQTYKINPDYFNEFIERLKYLKGRGNIGIIDAPPSLKQFITKGLD